MRKILLTPILILALFAGWLPFCYAGNAGQVDTGGAGQVDTGGAGQVDTGGAGQVDTGGAGQVDTGGTGRRVYKTLPNPLGSQTMTIGSVPQIVNKIINAILTIIGAIALLVVIYGGFMWMTSAGNENLVAKGKSTLMWAAIALAIIFLAWMLVGFLFQALGV